MQDGSLWWHGMFTRAGRMGNMASDIRSDGQEQGKKVCYNAADTTRASCSDGNLKFHLLLCSSVCGILLLLLDHLSFCGSRVLKVCLQSLSCTCLSTEMSWCRLTVPTGAQKLPLTYLHICCSNTNHACCYCSCCAECQLLHTSHTGLL